MIVIFASIKKIMLIVQNANTESCSREKMCQNPKKYQLVTEENIADIVVTCVNMPEDIKSFIVLGAADLI